jgi:hypothetical protein
MPDTRKLWSMSTSTTSDDVPQKGETRSRGNPAAPSTRRLEQGFCSFFIFLVSNSRPLLADVITMTESTLRPT